MQQRDRNLLIMLAGFTAILLLWSWMGYGILRSTATNPKKPISKRTVLYLVILLTCSAGGIGIITWDLYLSQFFSK